MENDGVDLSAGPDLSINPRRIVEEPINLAPQPRQNPAIGSGILGTNMAAPMSATAPAAENPLDAAEQQLIATRNKAMVGATNPVFNFWFEDQAKEKQKEVVDTNLKIQEIQQKKQQQKDMQTAADVAGLPAGSLPANATNDTLVNALTKRFKETGDVNTMNALLARGHKDIVSTYMPDAVASQASKAELESNVINKLNSAVNPGPNQKAYNDIVNSLSPEEKKLFPVPKTATEWMGVRNKVFQDNQKSLQMVDTFKQQRASWNDFTPETDKNAAEVRQNSFKMANGEVMPGTTAVTHLGNGATGVALPNGSQDPRQFGEKGKDAWSFMGKTERETLSKEVEAAVPKVEREKYVAFNRIYQGATHDAQGNALPADKINTNPNIQQGIAEGLASELRGLTGSANVGLMKIELAKRGWAQSTIDSLIASYAGGKGVITGKETAYLSSLTQKQIREVMDFLKDHNQKDITARLSGVAERTGMYGGRLEQIGLEPDLQEALKDPHAYGRDVQKYKISQQRAVVRDNDRVLLEGGKASAAVPGSVQTPLPLSALPGLTNDYAKGINQPIVSAPATPAALQPSTGGGGSPSNPQRGVSPDYLIKTARIESGNEPDPWKAGAQGTSASGAFQFIKSTWDANKPPGAPARAKDATPQQQTEAANNLTNKNVAALTKAGVPVNDTTAYVAHNLGAAGAVKFINAPDDAKARDVVGEEAAKNNPLFFRGNPTVGEVKARYQAAMNPASNNKNPTAEQIAAYNASKESFAAQRAKMAASATTNAANLAPAVGGALGGIAGSAVTPVAGTAIGAGLGGAAGGAVKNYFTGTPENQTIPGYAGEMGKGVVEATPMMIPGMGPAAMAARVAAGGASQAGLKAIEGGDTGDIIDAGVGGAAGSMLGEGAGIFGHALWSKFGPGPQKALMDAAKTLANEEPKIASASGKMVDNPAYVKAKQEIQSIGKDPDQVAHDTRAMQSSPPTPRGEAIASRPANIEAKRVGREEYQPIAAEIGAAGQGAKITPKAQPALSDGPLSTIRTTQNPNGTVPDTPELVKVAQHAEIAVTAAAKSVDAKWALLGDTREELLRGERDALLSTATNKSATAKAMRDIADSVRVQQEKMARALLPPDKADALIQRLEIADKNYRRAILAGAGKDGDIVKAIAQGGKEGREAQAAFDAVSGNDPVARRMVNSLVEMQKSKTERYGVGALVLSSAQVLHLFGPVGTVVAGGLTAMKAKQMLVDAMAKKGAGSQLTFKQILGNELRKENARKVGATIGANVGGQVAR